MKKTVLFFIISILSIKSHANTEEELKTKLAYESEVLQILHNEKQASRIERDLDINKNTSPWDKLIEYLNLSTIDEYFF